MRRRGGWGGVEVWRGVWEGGNFDVKFVPHGPDSLRSILIIGEAWEGFLLLLFYLFTFVCVSISACGADLV